MVARTLPQDSPGDSADLGASANTTTIAIQDGAAHVPAGIELAHADFDRDGSNLVIETGNGDTFVVEGYFTSVSKPVIEGTDGVALKPAMVTTLAQAGKGLFLAQAQMGRDITPGSEPIGKIVTAKGTVTVQHADGTTDTLQAGDPVYIYDVVITGADSELAIAFTDESVLSLSEDARMTLDRYIYNPDGAESNMLVGLLQGTLAVVSGQIAPEGDMEVSTPVATLGIRGTSAVIQLQDVSLRVALVTDVQDGQGGLIQIYNNTTNDLLITLTESEIGLIASLFAGSSDATLTNLTPEERALLTQTVDFLTSSYNQSQGNQGPNATPGSGAGDPNGTNTEDLNGDGNGEGNGEGDGGPGGDENDGGGDDSAVLPGPQLTLPAIPTILEDTPTVISGISVTGPSAVTITIVADGTFQLASIAQLTFLAIDGVAVTSGTVILSTQEFSSVTFSAPIAAARAALDGLTFTPNPDVNDLNITSGTSGQLAITAVGNGQTDTATLGINVTAVNDTPIITAPSLVTTAEDTTHNFTGLSISDPVEDVDIDETGSADPIKVTLVVDGASGEFVGTLGFSGSVSVNFTGGDSDGSDGTLEFKGSRAEVNDALAKLQFTPDQDFNDNLGDAKLTITVNDQGNSGIDPGTTGDAGSEEDIFVVDISVTPVNDAPEITAPTDVTTNEDTTFAFTGANALSIADVDEDEDGVSDPQLVTLQVDHGSLAFSGATTGIVFVDSDGSDGTLQFSGTAAEVNAALALLEYTPDENFNDDLGSEALTITVNDQGNSGDDPGLSGDTNSEEDQQVIAISVTPVNDAPEILGLQESAGVQAVNSGAFDAGPVEFGPGSGYTTPTINGFQTGDVLTFDITAKPQGGFAFTLLDGASSALAPFDGVVLRIAPSAYPDQIVDSYTVTGGDDTTLRYNIYAFFGGNPGYDITVTATSVGLTIDEDTSGTFSGLSINDVDAGTDPILVMLGVTNGALAFTGVTTGLAFTDSDGSDGTLEFTGSQDDINAALASLQYTPDQDYNGTDTLDITIDDQGANGIGGALTDSASVNIAINPVNDAPVIDTSSAGVQGAVFGGAVGDGILVDPIANMPASGDFSVTLAVKDATLDNTGGGNVGETYVSYAVTGNSNGNELLIINTASGLRVFIQETGVDVGNVVPQDGDWHHLAITYDSAAGTVDVYVDGDLVADDVGGFPTEGLTAGGSLYLGQDQDSVGGLGSNAADQTLVGSLGEVGFWNGQLTETQIGDIASNNFDPTDAEIFLSWNDSTTSFDDVSGGGNTPTTVGSVTTDADVIVTAVEDTTLNLSGITVSDVDVGTDPLNVTLTVSNGTLDFSGTDISGTLSGTGFSTVDVQSDAVAATPGSITTSGFSATTVNPGEPATLVGSTYSDIDFTNGGSDDGEISFEIEADFFGPNLVTIGFSDVDGNVSDPSAVTISEFVSILNDKLNDALSSTGETYATINGSGGIDISTLSADTNSQIQISTFTETNSATGSGLGNGFDTGEDPDYITFELSVDSGGNQTITIDNAAVTAVGNNDGVIDDAAEFAAVLNSLMTGATATDNGLGEVTIASDTTGTSSTIDISLYTASTSGGSTGLNDGNDTGTDGTPASISFDLDIDGAGPVSITIDAAKVTAYNIANSASLDASALTAQNIADLINDQAGMDVVSVSGGELVFASDIVGTNSSVEISGFTEALSSGTLGLVDGSDAGSGPNLTDISGQGTDTFSFSGTQSDINAILNGLIGYTPDQDFEGTDTLNIAVDDGGASGLGGTLSGNGSFDINVLPVNDAPAIDISAIADGANLLVNGGFETDAAASATTTLTGWSVTGDIDIIDPSWGPAEGTKSIDLHGTAPGVISQSFATEIGEVYTVSFQLAGYLAAGETINDVRVSAAGVTEDFSFDKTGALTVNDIQWETKTFSFVATSTTTTIEFSSLDAISGAGPVIDDVQAFETGAGAVTDEPLVISGIAISDVDAGSDPLTVTLSLSGTGTLDFTLGTNISALTGISGQGTGSLTFSGSQADVTAALASSIEYTSGSGFEGTETLQIDVSDGGSAGSGGAQISSETIDITVVSYPSSALGIWLFDDTSDSSGNARDLTLNGASLPSITSNGLIGGGIELDGSLGSSATVNSNNAVFDFGADDFTVQVWVNLDTFNTSEGVGSGYGEQVLVEKLDGDGSPGDPGWTLTYFGDSIVFGGNYDSGTQFGFQATTDPNLALNQWQQFVVTRSDDTFKIYQNGQLIGTFIGTETIGTSSNPLYIGTRNGGDGRNFTVDGTIDNVVIYDGAWTANDVIEQWNGGAGNAVFPGNPTNAPVIHAGSTLAYTENDPATAIDTAVYVFDADDTHIESATVEITGNFAQGQDVLAFVDTTNITGTYNPTTGILSLTGSDTLANYQAALRSVTYENTSDDPDSSARTISFTVNDGDTDSIPATSTITVTPTNDTPVAAGDTVLTNLGIGDTLYIPASILLSNDTDADGDNLAVTGAAGTGATFNSGTDEVEYVLASSLSSPETFTYDIEDPAGSSDTATVSVERGTSTNANEVTGTSADEFLIGTDLADILTGNGGDDTIIGGAGKDSILGGKGSDDITGGTNADLFVWHDGDLDGGAVDTITDFNTSEDTLDLAGLLDSAFTPGDTANYVHAVTDGFDTTVSVDSDGLANGVSFVDVVVLSGVTTGNITFVYDDASSTTTVAITS